jgi:cytoskeletal protein RodZ
MESYGEVLRKAREAKRVSIESITQSTAITKEYIESLENERVEDFPGESYFIGFLSNYCEFLGLNKEEILSLYHAKKIQESPVPLELLQKKKPAFLVPLIIFLSAAVLIATGCVLYFSVFKIPEKKEQLAKEQVEKEKSRQYQFSGKPETKRFYKGDQILIPAKQGNGNIVLTVSNTKGNFAILTPAGSQVIELSEERDIDIDGDGFADLIIYLSDVSNTDESHGAEIRILEKKLDNSYVEISPVQTENPDIPSSSTVRNNSARVVIHEDTRAYPFTINVTFRGACLFRYKSDRQPYVEDYYKSGELVTITSNNGTRLWMSNLNALKIHVIAGLSSYDLEVGKAGEVKVEDIKWVRDNDGKYRLVVLELD